jgi:hypothetical protein
MQHIHAAFTKVPRPEHIIAHECDECFKLRDDLQDKQPRQIPDAWIERNFDKLPLLTDEAKQFFLPAYLRVGALAPTSLVSEFVLYTLADDFRFQPVDGYSPEQKQAITNYLEFIAPHLDDTMDPKFLSDARTLWHAVT